MRGYTLIEIGIVLAVAIILSAVSLSYSRVTKGNIALQIDQIKVVNFLNRAKSFTLERKYFTSETSKINGFGISFENQKLILFKDLEDCDKDYRYDDADECYYKERVEELPLNAKIRFSSIPSDIFFEAPYLKVYYGGNLLSSATSVVLEIIDDPSLQATVWVGPGGDISF